MKINIAFQPSQGADGESEFDDEPLEEDELISDTEDVPVRAVAVIFSRLCPELAIYRHNLIRLKLKNSQRSRGKRRPKSEKLRKVSSK